MYKIKEYQWDLTEEEQEKAKFIIEFCEKSNVEAGRTGISDRSPRKGAFEHFKDKFYVDVSRRLGLKVSIAPYFSSEDSFGLRCLTLSDDGKLIGYRVEKGPVVITDNTTGIEMKVKE